MKKLFIIGNWKSNKTLDEAHSWFTGFFSREFSSWLHTPRQDETEKIVIICPPTTLLAPLSEYLQHHTIPLPFYLGAQDVSAFPEGAHTGQASARQLSEFVRYVIIGHSESRKELGETDEIVAEKVAQALSYHLEPIVCVQGKETSVPEGVSLIAYEPVEAIGSGTPDTPKHAEEVAASFKAQGIRYVLYGGSVTAENVSLFTSQPSINGVLVGGASLTPSSFAGIIQRA